MSVILHGIEHFAIGSRRAIRIWTPMPAIARLILYTSLLLHLFYGYLPIFPLRYPYQLLGPSWTTPSRRPSTPSTVYRRPNKPKA